MTQMKIGGVVLTGVGAYLILSKTIRMVERSVHDISTASQWRAYYKAFGKTGGTDMKPPEMEYEVKETTPLSEAIGDALTDAIKKTRESIKSDTEAPEGPLEGETEALDSEEKETEEKDKKISEVIDESQFIEDAEYKKFVLKWYNVDNVVTTNEDKVILEPYKFLGCDVLGTFAFSKNPNDDDIRYVRNFDTKSDFKILRMNASFSKLI